MQRQEQTVWQQRREWWRLRPALPRHWKVIVLAERG